VLLLQEEEISNGKEKNVRRGDFRKSQSFARE
jgi:hypothetical protein